jgi:type IV pilus assembly protein PilM
MNNNKKHKLAFGLDISDLSIKLVQLKSSHEKIKVQAISKYNLKKDIVVNGEIKDKEKLVEAIKEAIKKPSFGSFSTDNVVLSLPDNESFIKLIEIDKGPNPLPDLIEQEIEKYFPVGIDEIYYDYELMAKTEESYSVLIGACLKRIVDSYIDICKQAGLSIHAFETESVAIARCLLKEESPRYKNKENKAYAIIDIGGLETSMLIYANNSLVSCISLPINGEMITEKIAGTLEISPQQAEKAKIICGLDSDKAQGIIKDILSDVILSTTKRILEIIEYYKNEYPDFPEIKQIIISGGGSNVKNLDQIIAESLSIATLPGNIFTNIDDKLENFEESFSKSHNITLSFGKTAKNKQQNSTFSSKHNSSLAYATAFGLALRPYIS